MSTKQYIEREKKHNLDMKIQKLHTSSLDSENEKGFFCRSQNHKEGM